jgi:hypothetical protein
MEIASSLLKTMKDTLEEADVVSIENFIAGNRDSLNALLRSGKSIKEIYEYLKKTLEHDYGFRTVYYRAGLRRRGYAASAIQKKPGKYENTDPGVDRDEKGRRTA